MEKLSFNVHGGVKLPIGYRFHPTDEELVVHYLKRKVFGISLPASVIPDHFDVVLTDPCSFPGDLKEKRYFFSKRNGNDNDNKRKRVAGSSGYWKFTGKHKQIVAYESNQIVGIRRTLVFSQGRRSDSHETKRTQWIMHEYSLVGSIKIPNSVQICNVEYGDWLVYTVFQKKRKPKKSRVSSTSRIMKPSVVDFTIEESSDNGPPRPSSPSSNGNSEVSFDALDQEESSSSHTDFSSFSFMRKK